MSWLYCGYDEVDSQTIVEFYSTATSPVVQCTLVGTVSAPSVHSSSSLLVAYSVCTSWYISMS